MPFLSNANQERLRERFERDLSSQVTIRFFTLRPSPIIIPGRDCPACEETGQLLEELTSLSDKLTLTTHDFYKEPERAVEMDIKRIPAFILEAQARGKVRYFGIPAGHEFPSFIEDLVEVSKGRTSLTEESRMSLYALSRDVHIQVFITPT